MLIFDHQVCGVCKTCGCHGGKAQGVLHDRWQRGQNTGAPGTLHRSCQEQGCGGMQVMPVILMLWVM